MIFNLMIFDETCIWLQALPKKTTSFHHYIGLMIFDDF